MRQNTKISSDYIGVAREQLREVFGCPVMILQGAAGNLKPAGVDKVEGGSLDDLHRVADAFVRAAKQLRFEPVDVEDIRMTSIHTSFVSDVPSQEESEKRAARTQHGEADGWLASCDELRQRGVRVQSVPAEIHFFKLNEGCICGVAEEIFCELALAVWDRTENPLLFLNGYTNGCTGYLPTRDEWFKGGYEVYDSNFVYHKYHGHVMPYRAETADLLVERVLEGWEQMGHCRGSGTFPLG